MLVSCIMPTRGRAQWVHKALQCWREQTYIDRELIILDDFDCTSFRDGWIESGVRYEAMRRHLNIGEKRNIACSRAAGEIICHWDDDDCSAPNRIERQLDMLMRSGKQVSGFHSMRFTDGTRWWHFTSPYAFGTSLMYWRSYWERNPFPPQQSGEDTCFVVAALGRGDIASADAGDLMYATNHPNNTCARTPHLSPNQWRPILCAPSL
jgi:glycosyltransferase involved in cell wall biosynthesis